MIFEFNADEILQMAITIERNGIVFYRKAQQKTDDPEIKEIFGYLEQQEVEHARLFEALKASLPESAMKEAVWDPEHENTQYLRMMADMHVFVSGDGTEKELAKVNTGIEALKMAMQFEKDSIVFFLELRDATEESTARENLGRLVKEEQQHLRKLAVKLRSLAS